MDAEEALEDIDRTLTAHFLRGRGWRGFTLVLPKDYHDSILLASKSGKINRLHHIAIKMNPKGRTGKITLNLEGKVIGGGIRRLDVPVKIVDLLKQAKIERLHDPVELSLIRQIALYPRIVEAAATAHEPHRIAFYLYDLASEFHALWTRGRDMPHLRFIIQNDAEVTIARLALVQGVVSVLASGLAVLGVHAPDEMR